MESCDFLIPLKLGRVVDEELKAYGVERLRVVDTSIMPAFVGADICQMVYAIAMKAADLIEVAKVRRTTLISTVANAKCFWTSVYLFEIRHS